MKIIIDSFGGDNAPLEVIKGSIKAKENLNADICLVGDESKIKKCAEENSLDISSLEIRHAAGVIDICKEPTEILKSESECSMAVGMKMLANGEGDAFVSAGSTGALVVGATFIVKRLKGIKRAALATVLPTAGNPIILLDAGANADCRPEMLLQFAVMGSIYMNKVMNIDTPSVRLANIGEEPSKGRELETETYKLLSSAPLKFDGNIEARDMPKGICDVVVADGYTGNMLLKLYEGMGKFFSSELKNMLLTSFTSKLAALLLLKKVNRFKKKMDYSEYGGAPLLGTSKPVIKAHGSSNSTAFYNAIKQACMFTETNVIGEVKDSLLKIKENKTDRAAEK